ncbi:HDOD domain-containing protein [Engelhardtia mirabilis]|uniref:HDOD domain protein n=1 Tax=Engelhardtia mirabilis TaxID=2528011 RepID=A0A518BGH2_9BACT|nr:HDOD domain protein [Planctomycetes bacterium Pla133]QDV00387.1 HDOD domain protein [Planctomycetes bacterium Pla86]
MPAYLQTLWSSLVGLFGAKSAPPAVARPRPSSIAPRATAVDEAAAEQSTQRGVGNLDDLSGKNASFGAKDVAIVRRIELRMRNGDLEVPQLSSTAMTLLEILNRPTAEMSEIADVFATDPSLSGQLLSAANSVMGGSRVGQTSIKACVVRVGMRGLRGMILAASMRSHLFNGRVANIFAEMAWRQALSVAGIARAIAPQLGEDPDTAFTVGLLHDIGKMPLLSMLATEAGERSIDQALVGLLFMRLHEAAGAAVAEEWQLGRDLISVCGRHHQFQKNLEFTRQATMASLAHQLDLYLSLADEVGFRALKRAQQMETLGLSDGQREAVLAAARKAFVAVTDSDAPAAKRAA